MASSQQNAVRAMDSGLAIMIERNEEGILGAVRVLVYHEERMDQKAEEKDLLTDVLALSFAVTSAFRFRRGDTSKRQAGR